jgi:hypothetical protein
MMMQEVYDRVAKHLLQQMRPAKEINPKTGKVICKYRVDNGDSCAVGCLIKDEFYRIYVEGSGVEAFFVQEALGYSGIAITEEMVCMLTKLQRLHDTTVVENWALGLCEIAIYFGLIPYDPEKPAPFVATETYKEESHV